jgi:hypothetical protein
MKEQGRGQAGRACTNDQHTVVFGWVRARDLVKKPDQLWFWLQPRRPSIDKASIASEFTMFVCGGLPRVPNSVGRSAERTERFPSFSKK